MEIITLEDLLTSSGQHKDREQSPECTEEVKQNAIALLAKVNPFLEELGIDKVIVNSGFRTVAANNALANSAQKSNHEKGKAVDISDVGHVLAKKVLARPDLLEKYQLWIEDIGSTSNWMHLDNAIRSERPLRMFKP